MALRNQPYFPFYVNDFTSDEKLILCSAESTGVYIRLMCLMHKSEEYGVIMLKQMFNQTTKQVHNFALQIAKFLPYDVDVVERSIDELITNNVLTLDGDRLYQRRMVKDEKTSQIRAEAGSKGGKKTQSSITRNSEKNTDFASKSAKAKSEANTEYVNEYVNESSSDKQSVKAGKRKPVFIPPTYEEVKAYIEEKGYNVNARTFFDYFDTGNWIDKNGVHVSNWKQKVITWSGRSPAVEKPQSGVRKCHLGADGEIEYES